LDTVELVIDSNENLLDRICFRKNSVWIKSRVPILAILLQKQVLNILADYFYMCLSIEVVCQRIYRFAHD